MDNEKSKIRKKPKFKRQNFLLSKLKESWRKPKGLHSKLRLKRRGKGKRPKIGYGTNKESKGLIKNQRYVYISNVKGLENVKQPILISSNTGLKKKLEIVKKAEELNLKIINVNAKKLLEKLKNRKEKKAEETAPKEKTKKENKKDETKEEKRLKIKEERK
jgi:large subunit ribosomal protein L32e